jgi:membrane protease YdiL (CAAX protease family)
MYQMSFKLYPIYQRIDPDDAFMYLFLHHIMQSVMYILLIILAGRLLNIKFRDFGFNLNNVKTSVTYSFVFVIIWAIIQFSVSYVWYVNGYQFNLNFEMNHRNMIGYFLFEIFLSGTSEELFYRGLIVTVILKIMQEFIKKQRNLNILAIFISVIVFMAGHINFTLFPFRITYFNFLQQLTVISVTIFYCITFFKTKSLLGPILMHNLLNGVVTFSTYFYSFLSN